MRPPERAGANKCEKKKKKKGGRGDDVEATLAERRRQNRCTFFLEQKNRYERTNEARHHRLPIPNYYFFFCDWTDWTVLTDCVCSVLDRSTR